MLAPIPSAMATTMSEVRTRLRLKLRSARSNVVEVAGQHGAHPTCAGLVCRTGRNSVGAGSRRGHAVDGCTFAGRALPLRIVGDDDDGGALGVELPRISITSRALCESRLPVAHRPGAGAGRRPPRGRWRALLLADRQLAGKCFSARPGRRARARSRCGRGARAGQTAIARAARRRVEQVEIAIRLKPGR